jgi:2-polyprenyl-6-methoxyphenol hydroxylase-like FAD-dependent oxidoreductase
MRVIIAGGGNVGTFIAADLQQAGHEVTIVEVDNDRAA